MALFFQSRANTVRVSFLTDVWMLIVLTTKKWMVSIRVQTVYLLRTLDKKFVVKVDEPKMKTYNFILDYMPRALCINNLRVVLRKATLFFVEASFYQEQH